MREIYETIEEVPFGVVVKGQNLRVIKTRDGRFIVNASSNPSKQGWMSSDTPPLGPYKAPKR